MDEGRGYGGGGGGGGGKTEAIKEDQGKEEGRARERVGGVGETEKE